MITSNRRAGNHYDHNDWFCDSEILRLPGITFANWTGISQFINKEKISSVIDLGSGYGRITNFLNDTTKATIFGYELDREVFDISKKNKKINVNIENKNILNVDYQNLKVECFILNDPLHRKTDLEYLIRKIGLSRINFPKKYYLIIINVDEKKMHIFNNHKLLKSTFASQSRCVKFFSN